MPGDWHDDEELLAELGAAIRAEREVPESFLRIGRSAFAWYSIDAELAALTYDSADVAEAVPGTRAESGQTRAMTFTARELSIELESTPAALFGQIVPAQTGTIEMQTRDGGSTQVPVDEVGWLVIRPLPAGLFRLRVHAADGGEITTEWISL